MAVTVRQKRLGRGNPWHVFIHQNGRIISRKPGNGSKREAEALAVAVRRQMAKGDFVLGRAEKAKSPDIIVYARSFIENYAKVACKENTWKSYQSLVKVHLEPEWTGIRLHKITRANVKQLLLKKQQEGLAPGTVQNIKAFISGIFTHAYEDEILDRNPALKLGKFIKKQDRHQHVRFLNREEASEVLVVARREFPKHYPILLCAFRTGMRMGELLGLAWSDIDFETNIIEVRRSYSHGHFDTPKSHKSRYVDMSDQLKRTLCEHREALKQQFGGQLPTVLVPGKSKKETAVQLLFPSRIGGPTDGDNFRKRVFYKLIEIADVPRFRFHDIRHTFASLLLQQGESLHYVKEQLGHASIQTTVDVYGHLAPGSNRNAVNRLDDPVETGLRLVDAG